MKEQQNKESRKLSNEEIINLLRNELKGENMDKADLDNLLNRNLSKYVKEFLTILDKELKKFFLFFSKLEKETYNEIKGHLYLEFNYSNLSLSNVLEEIQKLEELCFTTIDLAQYINVNVTAIRKILKKFDKIFQLYENPIALYYLKKNLTDSSSQLFRIMQFKIIDESSVLIEKISTDLEKCFKEKIKKVDKSELNDLLTESLLKDVNLEMISGMKDENLKNFIQEKFFRIHELIEKIDDSNNLIRSNVEIWTLLIRSNILLIQEKQHSNKDCLLNIKQNEIIDQLTPQVKTDKSEISKENLWNVWICLAHTFIYTMNCWIVQPTNGLYIASMRVSPYFTGIIMGLTPLAAVFSTIIYSYWTNFSYKSPLIFSCICFFIGNFLYCYADYVTSIWLMGLGRFLIGFGGGKVINRRYLIDNVPKDYIMFFSLLYVVFTCLGMSAGPGFALVLLYLPDYNTEFLRLNMYTNPCWFCLVIWIKFFFVILHFFKESAYKQVNEYSKIENNFVAKEDYLYKPQNQMVMSDSNNKLTSKETSVKLSSTETESEDMVKREIQELLNEEEKTFSFLGTAFLILVFVLLIIRMNTECLLVLAPITVPYEYGLSLTMTSFFFQVTALIVLPICKFIDIISKKYKERQLLLILLVISTISSIMLIKMFWVISLSQYLLFYTLLFICTNILESVASSLTAKIFPTSEDCQHKILNSGFVIIMATSGGKFLGALLVTLFGLFGHDHVQNLTFWFYAICFFILSYVTWRNYDVLRVKAIARIKMKEDLHK